MALGTLVDSNVLLDVFTGDPRWGGWSADAHCSPVSDPDICTYCQHSRSSHPSDGTRSAVLVCSSQRALTAPMPPPEPFRGEV